MAIDEMQRGLRMAKIFDLSIDRMGDKDDIIDFTGRHSEEFPESEFPSK